MDVIEDSKKRRKELDSFIDQLSELFPYGIENGYQMKDTRRSEKSGIPIRRIIVGDVSYTIQARLLDALPCGIDGGY